MTLNTANFQQGVGRVVKDTERMNKSASKYNATVNRTSSFLRRFGASFVGVYAIRGMFNLLAREAGQFELVMAKVAKTTRLGGYDIEKLSAAATNLGVHLGTSRKQVGLLMRSVGRLNISGAANIEEFSEVVAKFSEATNFDMEQAGTQLARFLNLTNNAPKEVRRIASSIVHLGNNFAASETEITHMALALSQSTAAFGLTDRFLTAISATLSASGARVESAATAYNKLFIAADKFSRQGGEGLQVFADIMGTTAEAAKQLIETDIEGFMVKFLGALGTLQQGDQIKALAAIGLPDVRSVKTILPVAKQEAEGGELSRAIGLVETQTTYGEALQKEFERRTGELAVQFSRTAEVVAQDIQNLATALGEFFLPVVRATYDTILQWPVKFTTYLFDGLSKTDRFQKLFAGTLGQMRADAFGTDPDVEANKIKIGVLQNKLTRTWNPWSRASFQSEIEDLEIENAAIIENNRREEAIVAKWEARRRMNILMSEHGDPQSFMNFITATVGKYRPEGAFNYETLDERIQAMDERLVGRRINILQSASSPEEARDLTAIARQELKVEKIEERVRQLDKVVDGSNDKEIAKLREEITLENLILASMNKQYEAQRKLNEQKAAELVFEKEKATLAMELNLAHIYGAAGEFGGGDLNAEAQRRFNSPNRFSTSFFGHNVPPGLTNIASGLGNYLSPQQVRNAIAPSWEAIVATDRLQEQIDKADAIWAEHASKTEESLRRIGDTFADVVATPIRSFFRGDSLTDVWLSMIDRLKAGMLELLIIEPIMARVRQAFNPGAGGGSGSGILAWINAFSNVIGLFGGGGGAGYSGNSYGPGQSFPSGVGNNPSPAARGGVARRGGLALVGEQGAEIVRLAAGDAVFPNGSVPAGAAGGTTNIFNTYAEGVTEARVKEIVADAAPAFVDAAQERVGHSMSYNSPLRSTMRSNI